MVFRHMESQNISYSLPKWKGVGVARFSGPAISLLSEYDQDFLAVSMYFNLLMLRDTV